MLNNVVLIGRLTKDPELKYTQGGKAVATLRLAVDRGSTNAQGEKETDFLTVVVWERQAETTANYLQKGRLVAVQGRIQVRTYDTQEGQRREVTEIVAREVKFLDRAPDAERPAPPKHQASIGAEPSFDDDDDVPF